MTQETIEQLNRLLSPAAKVVWEAAVRQQYIIGIEELAGGVIWGLLLITCCIGVVKAVRTPDEEWSPAIGLGSGVIGFLALFFCFLLIGDGLAHVLNPNAGAINWLLHGQG